MESIINFYLFFGAFFSVIISLGQLAQRKKTVINYIYSSSFFGLGIWLCLISLYASGLFAQRYLIKIFMIPISFMVPPLMVLRYKWIITSKFHFKPHYIMLLLPAFLSILIILVPLFDASLTIKSEYLVAQSVFSDQFQMMPGYYKMVYLLYPLPKVFLIVSMIPTLITMAIVWKKSTGNTILSVSRIGYIFASLIVVSNVISVVGDLFSVGILKFSLFMANTVMIILYIVTQKNPDYNKLLKIEMRRAHYERSRIMGLDVDRIVERLYEIMNDEKAFADEGLTLKDLARDLGVSPHQLSQILNEKMQKNFNTFINKFRVEEAKTLLLEEPDRSILSVGVAAGFNSNTTFCTVFAKNLGMSPGQYRKKNLKRTL